MILLLVAPMNLSELVDRRSKMAENVIAGVTKEQIDEWKVKFGEVYVAKFSEEEKYVYRPLRRLEYKQIMTLGQNESKTFAEEKVVQMCVVHPVIDPSKMSMLKAGTISTLVDLIMAASNFGVAEEPIKL
jgi:hypothetical protein